MSNFEIAQKAFLAKNWKAGVAAARMTDMTHASLQYYMGWCCLNGYAVPKDEKLAFSWFVKSSAQGDSSAMAMMGYCYRNGYGVAQDDAKAFEWYQKAAMQESASAKFALARCYEFGRGCRVSDVMAFRNYREAAEGGFRQALFHYAQCLEEGFGTERDRYLACKWYRKAYAAGVAEAGKRLQDMGEKLDECVAAIPKPKHEQARNAGGARPAVRHVAADSAEAELRRMIGLESVKEKVIALQNTIKLERRRAEVRGREQVRWTHHFVFTGNPGTGKTNVARILAKLLHEIGVTNTDKCVETDRSGLVAEYTGQTGPKTNVVIDSALDGVLFIDEAYSLVRDEDDGYGQEAVDTLLRRMENDRNRLVVIVAGYTKEMEHFLDSNPGLRGRFRHFIEFPDYTADELVRIFELNVGTEMFLSAGVKEEVERRFRNVLASHPKNFDNGRFVRRFFEDVMERADSRLGPIMETVDENGLFEIMPEDLPPVQMPRADKPPPSLVQRDVMPKTEPATPSAMSAGFSEATLESIRSPRSVWFDGKVVRAVSSWKDCFLAIAEKLNQLAPEKFDSLPESPAYAGWAVRQERNVRHPGFYRTGFGPSRNIRLREVSNKSSFWRENGPVVTLFNLLGVAGNRFAVIG